MFIFIYGHYQVPNRREFLKACSIAVGSASLKGVISSVMGFGEINRSNNLKPDDVVKGVHAFLDDVTESFNGKRELSDEIFKKGGGYTTNFMKFFSNDQRCLEHAVKSRLAPRLLHLSGIALHQVSKRVKDIHTNPNTGKITNSTHKDEQTTKKLKDEVKTLHIISENMSDMMDKLCEHTPANRLQPQITQQMIKSYLQRANAPLLSPSILSQRKPLYNFIKFKNSEREDGDPIYPAVSWPKKLEEDTRRNPDYSEVIHEEAQAYYHHFGNYAKTLRNLLKISPEITVTSVKKTETTPKLLSVGTMPQVTESISSPTTDILRTAIDVFEKNPGIFKEEIESYDNCLQMRFIDYCQIQATRPPLQLKPLDEQTKQEVGISEKRLKKLKNVRMPFIESQKNTRKNRKNKPSQRKMDER